MNILLTGASGFLGSALALSLHSEGHDVALLLRPSSKLIRLSGANKAFRIGRPRDDRQIGEFVRDVQPEAVVHTACAYGRQGESDIQIMDANLRFGLAIIDSVIRQDEPVTFLNTGTVLAPETSSYALSKTQFSQWGKLASGRSAGRLRFINVLLQHMYGPGDDTSKFTTHVLHACQRNEPRIALTGGEQRRDFIYIDDVVSAYSALLTHAASLDAGMDVDVGSGEAPTIRTFVETVHRLTGSATELAFGAVPYRTNEPQLCQADVAQMSRLGWKPVYDIQEGLKRTIEVERVAR